MGCLKGHGRPRGPILCKDPFLQAIMEAVEASGLDDGYITRRAGIGRNELSNWRGAHATPSVVRVGWVLEVIGVEVVLRGVPGGIDRRARAGHSRPDAKEPPSHVAFF